jgi:hypothetical protein
MIPMRRQSPISLFSWSRIGRQGGGIFGWLGLAWLGLAWSGLALHDKEGGFHKLVWLVLCIRTKKAEFEGKSGWMIQWPYHRANGHGSGGRIWLGFLALRLIEEWWDSACSIAPLEFKSTLSCNLQKDRQRDHHCMENEGALHCWIPFRLCLHYQLLAWSTNYLNDHIPNTYFKMYLKIPPSILQVRS